MLVRLLNGRTVKINLREHDAQAKDKSLLQTRVGLLLKERYPSDRIFEEVYVPGEKFTLDFFIPSLRLVVECNGRQHYERVPFFQRTEQAFKDQQQRDERKRQWCQLNHFRLIEIGHNDIR